MLKKNYVLMMCLAAALLSACSENGADQEASVTEYAAAVQTVLSEETEVTTQM